MGEEIGTRVEEEPIHTPWPRRLLCFLGGAAALFMVVVVTHGLSECRTARVILASSTHSDTTIRLDLVYKPVGAESPIHERLWTGPLEVVPTLLPFRYQGESSLRIEVNDPGPGDIRVAHNGYITFPGSTHYYFIGPNDIVYSWSHSGYFRRANLSKETNSQLGLISLVSDILTCLM